MNLINITQRYLKLELETESEPSEKMLSGLEDIYNFSKSFYQNNHFEMKEKPKEESPEDSEVITSAQNETNQKVQEDPYETNNDPDSEMPQIKITSDFTDQDPTEYIV